MSRLLVAFDGSEGAERAARLAAQWAQRIGADVVLVNAIPPMPELEHVPSATAATLAEGYRRYAEKVCADGAAALSGPVQVRCEVVIGAPAEAIADYARKPDIELIVVGGGARGLLSRAMLGSVTSRLVQISPRPVLVAR